MGRSREFDFELSPLNNFSIFASWFVSRRRRQINDFLFLLGTKYMGIGRFLLPLSQPKDCQISIDIIVKKNFNRFLLLNVDRSDGVGLK